MTKLELERRLRRLSLMALRRELACSFSTLQAAEKGKLTALDMEKHLKFKVKLESYFGMTAAELLKAVEN